MNEKFNWELIAYETYRAKIHDGWVVKTGTGIVFIPDIRHEWNIKECKQ